MDPAATSQIDLLIRPQLTDLGGFTVRRALPDVRWKMVGPFIFFDHMGPARFEPGNGIDVRQHPHIGIATVTYLFEGKILHRDSLGCEQVITPGAVNWMTAGRGIVHSERTPANLRDSGSGVHGIQAWVALPRADEECDPAFEHYPADDIPSLSVDGVDVRVVVGSAFGVTSPVRTASDTLYVEVDLPPGGRLTVPGDWEEFAIYVVDGQIGTGAETHPAGTMIVAAPGAAMTLAAEVGTKVMLLGGAAMDGRRTIWWNFVSSSKERIEQAKSDWRENRFARVDGERDFIPLPES